MIRQKFLEGNINKQCSIMFQYCQENEIKRKDFKIPWIYNKTVPYNDQMENKENQELYKIGIHTPPQIYQGKCICGETYIGETVWNVESRWKAHQDVRKTSKPAKHLSENPDHMFERKCLTNALSKKESRTYWCLQSDNGVTWE